MPYLVANARTWVKRAPWLSTSLPPTERFEVPVKQKLGVVDVYEDVQGHVRVVFADKVTVGGQVWYDAYLYGPHWSGITQVRKLAVAANGAFSRPGSSLTLQPTPYYVAPALAESAGASVAMMLGTIWSPSAIAGKTKDYKGSLLAFVDAQAKSAAPEHALSLLGIAAHEGPTTTIGALKEHLEAHPVILAVPHRDGTHYVCARGFNRATGGVIVNDPCGKRSVVGSTNQWEQRCKQMTDTYGLGNEWSIAMLDALWAPGGESQGRMICLDSSVDNCGNGEVPIARTPKSTATRQVVEIPAQKVDDGKFSANFVAQIKAGILVTCHPQLPPEEVNDLVSAIADLCPKYRINTPIIMAHFLSQVAHESGGYWWLEEQASGEDYEFVAELGNEDPGDGVRNKGVGLIQLTGEDNIEKFFEWCGMAKTSNPKLITKYPLALLSAIYYWDREGLSDIAAKGADDEILVKITRRINGGENGIADRRDRFQKLRTIMLTESKSQTKTTAKGVNLLVKYRSQLDNATDHHGAGNRQCNLTSVTMMADFVLSGTLTKQAKSAGDSEPEELYGRLLRVNHGADSTDHDGHTRCLKAEFGIDSYWSHTLSPADLRLQLDKGIPVVIGVAYKNSGHIVCLVGYEPGLDGTTWLIHDPYGTRHGAANSYDVGEGGDYERYSQKLMDQVFWDGGEEAGWGRVVTAIKGKPTGMPMGL